MTWAFATALGAMWGQVLVAMVSHLDRIDQAARDPEGDA
jgi:hypothetical protein